MPWLDFGFPAHLHDLGAPFWDRVASTFGLEAPVLSRPSIVATTWRSKPLRTAVAHALKLPAHIEGRVTRGPRRLAGTAGGWEAVLHWPAE
jgi:hypothetical protein